MARLSTVFSYCVSDGVPRPSLVVALVVGVILNAINQGDTIARGANVNVVKMLLTFAVPYCVATYGAASYRLSAATPINRAMRDAN